MNSGFGLSPTVVGEHVVIFYERDLFLAECVVGYLRQGFDGDADVLVVATEPHRDEISQLLWESTGKSPTDHPVTMLDAHYMLGDLLVNGEVHPDRFYDRVAPWLQASARAGRRSRIYGEMVAVLWKDGRFESALRLERLWNQLSASFAFHLLCGYPMSGFGDESSTTGFGDICCQHTAVATESYTSLCEERNGSVPMVALNGGAPGGRIHRN